MSKKVLVIIALVVLAVLGLRAYRNLQSGGSEPQDEFLRDPAHEFGTSTAGIEEMRANKPQS